MDFFGMFGNRKPTSQPGQSFDGKNIQRNILNNIATISGYVQSGFLKKVKDDLTNILLAIQALKNQRDVLNDYVQSTANQNITPTELKKELDALTAARDLEGDAFLKERQNLLQTIKELEAKNLELDKVNNELKKDKTSEPEYIATLRRRRDELDQNVVILENKIVKGQSEVLQNCSEMLNDINDKLEATVTLFKDYETTLNVIINQIKAELEVEEEVPVNTAAALNEVFNNQPPQQQQNNGAEETKENGPEPGPTGGKFFNKKGGYYYPTSSSSKRNKKSVGRRKKHKRTNKTRR